ncbi:hypothetical protein AQJ84_03485 [Streptomyces resistomycificus]|uniref:Uncharacterized protein n=1 Tax=Streptomyces resistomycificus TaxID=67356 RepID=A0A0L8KTB7_9ACTN|nr:hypothetical protein ADK37_36285 [Streptomyces resistomycificus]KUO01514.1 hypothetical protein AQJ84_03485 [Streptomyces resistomycificus]
MREYFGIEAATPYQRVPEEERMPGTRCAHTGRFCCSTYCRTTLSGAPPAVPEKQEPDHGLLARQ